MLEIARSSFFYKMEIYYENGNIVEIKWILCIDANRANITDIHAKWINYG